MTDECIFCRIVDGEIPARTVEEGDAVLAFLDANPLARGHTLVIPKSHHETVAELPEETGEAVFDALYRLTPAVERAVDADGSTIGLNNGRAAGQEVPHVHGHVVPRFEGDGVGALHTLFSGTVDLAEEELDDIAERIKGGV
jgi:histidine triad (HIT) family protein